MLFRSFIEIMIVLAIVAIGAALAIPAIDAGLDAREVRRAVRQIAATMNHLRMEAVSTGTMRRLRIDPRENAIETDDRSRWVVLSERALIERVDGGAITADGKVDVIFYANGSTSGADIVIASRRDRTANRMRLVLDPRSEERRVGKECRL